MNIDIKHLASIAKIWMSDEEADEIGKDLSPLLEMAELLAAADMSGTVAAADVANAVDTAGTSGAPAPSGARGSVPVDALREDTPMPGTGSDIYYEQSPSEGGDGFTIPRLLD
ncbi:MAG: hypothetical protein FWH01_02475 [Oscillospiraceae bacterium]|nr:hypothetical protein [Oscillospiraceae bacterium]